MTTDVPASVRTAQFGDLTIAYDDRVLIPRLWTVAQSRWAADLLAESGPTRVLELCSGVGHIGLLAVRGTDAELVQVDADPHACDLAEVNASRSGLRVEVRRGCFEDALRPDEQFDLIIADPPWVPSDDVSRFPEDPVWAIDGGQDGLDVARACTATIGRHLVDGGRAVLQLGSAEQVDLLTTDIGRAGLAVVEVRRFPRGALVLLRR